jgi:hypothetical protein
MHFIKKKHINQEFLNYNILYKNEFKNKLLMYLINNLIKEYSIYFS